MISNKVVKNASWIIICKIVRALLSLLITMLTARYFGPSNFGLINYAAAIVAFAEPIMQLGLNNTLVQEFITDPEKEGEALGSSIIMSLCSAVLCIAGIIVFVGLTNAGSTEAMLVCGLYSLCLIFQAIELSTYWFQSKLLSKYSSVVSLIGYFLVSVYKFILLATKQSIYWFAVSNAIDFAFIAVVLLVLYRRLGGQKLSFSFERCRKLFARSRPYIVSGLMVTIFAQTDKIMLKSMIGSDATGYYSAAVSCACMTGFVFAAIIDSMRPTILENKRVSQEAFENSMISLYSVIIFFSLIQSLLMTIGAELVIKLVYGAEYAAAVNPLRLVVWFTTFAYLGAVRNIWILAEEKQQYLWIINLLGALGNVLLNSLLIPGMGLMGAALASLATQIFTNIGTGYIIKPIRKNNELMLRSLNPKYIAGITGMLRRRLLRGKRG